MKKLVLGACLVMLANVTTSAERRYVQGIYSLSEVVGLNLYEGSVSSGSVSLTDSIDDLGNGIGFAVGYLFDNGFGIEGGYRSVGGVGVTSTARFREEGGLPARIGNDTLNGSFTVTQEAEGTALYLAPIAYVYAEPLLLKGKIGYARFDVKNKSRISGSGTFNGGAISADTVLDSVSEGGTRLMYGLSAEYQINETLGIVLGYNHINDVGGGRLLEADVTSLELSLVGYF